MFPTALLRVESDRLRTPCVTRRTTVDMMETSLLDSKGARHGHADSALGIGGVSLRTFPMQHWGC